VSEFDAAPSGAGRAADETAVPVFTDPSGQRRRKLRRVGIAASVLLVGALILVVTGLIGGPGTPFSLWGAPKSAAHGSAAPGLAGSSGGNHGRGAPPPRLIGPTASAQVPHPSPAASPTPSHAPSATPSGSPSSTNPAGRTPPGRTRSKKPHPTKSPHGR
jgi:hypothetical protein